jgi:hypothetical protein
MLGDRGHLQAMWLLPFPAAVELDRIVTEAHPSSLIDRHAAGALLLA